MSRNGVLVIRAWCAEGATEPLRTRIQLAPDVLSSFDRTPALTQVDTACRLVEEWLRAIRLGYSTSRRGEVELKDRG